MFGIVALGDVLVILAFISYGLTTHAIHPLAFPRHTVITSTPFASSWFLLAYIGGLYRVKTIRSIQSTLFRTAGVWIGACVLGGAIRSTSLFPGEAPFEFLLVMVGFGLIAILPWRLIVTLAEHVRHNHQGRTKRTGQS